MLERQEADRDPSLTTHHQVFFEDARALNSIANTAVDFIVTSPPYPMVKMWDQAFSSMHPDIGLALNANNGPIAYELMHQELDHVWAACHRVLKDGAIICINIGDAVRTLDENFQLYANHARIIQTMTHLGFSALPDILWRKPTNAPNKFMGSGMLPSGAYVTYEHEYILVFRKGNKRLFNTPEAKQNRRHSAYFWEERNLWFSDLWTDLKGTTQELADPISRSRSAAYPFSLAYRLICMYSVYGDTILDPFLGTGTTLAAAITAGRHSLGTEFDTGLANTITTTAKATPTLGSNHLRTRLNNHQHFVNQRQAAGRSLKYYNQQYHFPVVTTQEIDIRLYAPLILNCTTANHYSVQYEEILDNY